jgi:hypothetical protein
LSIQNTFLREKREEKTTKLLMEIYSQAVCKTPFSHQMELIKKKYFPLKGSSPRHSSLS